MPEEVLTADVSDEEEKKVEEVKLSEEVSTDHQDEEPVEQSPYEEELARIEAEKQEAQKRVDAVQAELEKEKAERKRQMELKDEALKKEKSKTADIGEKWKNEALQEWERRQDLRDARAKVADITADPTAQKVVLHYFETLPDVLRTGSVDDQLLTALALANRKRLPNLLNAEQMEDVEERRSLSSMGGNDGGSRSAFRGSTSAKTQVANKLSSMYAKGNSDPNLAKRLAERAQKRLENK